jgi:hypothetical protein
MHMHRTARVAAMAMQPAMQAPGGRIRRIGAGQRFGIIGIDDNKIAGLDPGEMHLVGVHQEPRAILVDRQAEVVGDRLVHIKPRGPAKGGGQIDAFLPVVHVGADVGDGHEGSPV